ncbi:flagellar hook assembly protein FlgD [Comamonas composti]|uniref:flagellar hook assembly protein FlgD n=1 Tax=Comamonas composti TaxID=408558 RepID=UPI000419F9E9|nr:flagellar hook capping FlgD N-terminal domain-containing protein [Comamonas composti]
MIYGIGDTSALAEQQSGTGKTSVTDPAAAQDRFLKLLVAQLKHQDPMNPMDNAQMTTQMAQINTVSGIQQLNQTMQGMAGQFSALQAMQGTTMIGRAVLVQGNTLGQAVEDKHMAAFELAGPAASVKVQITTASGELVDTIELGPAEAGRNYFSWDAQKYTGDTSQLRFSVQADNAGQAVSATTLSPHQVIATGTSEGRLMLELSNGKSISYGDVRAVY